MAITSRAPLADEQANSAITKTGDDRNAIETTELSGCRTNTLRNRSSPSMNHRNECRVRARNAISSHASTFRHVAALAFVLWNAASRSHSVDAKERIMSSHSTSRIAARLSLGAALTATLIAQAACTDDADRGVMFSAGPTRISFAAVQDGNGPWLGVEAASDGTVSFTPTAATYGIAVVCEAGASQAVTVVQTTVAETRSQADADADKGNDRGFGAGGFPRVTAGDHGEGRGRRSRGEGDDRRYGASVERADGCRCEARGGHRRSCDVVERGVRWRTSGRDRRELCGQAEVGEDAAGHVRISNERQDTKSIAALRAQGDLGSENALEQRGPIEPASQHGHRWRGV